MEDFKIMFPSMDYEVIECVLRSNNGAVDATIDQLLQMSIDGQGSDDSSDSDDSIPPEVSGKGPRSSTPLGNLMQTQPDFSIDNVHQTFHSYFSDYQWDQTD